MATEVKLPRLGQGMESGTIVRWLKMIIAYSPADLEKRLSYHETLRKDLHDVRPTR